MNRFASGSMPTHRPTLSKLGFGCASAGGRTSRREALNAMAAAYDAGVYFYDTARSYGFGQSEAIVGEFLRGRRESVTLCTKFGILPAEQPGWKQRLRPLARTLLRTFPELRRRAQGRIADQVTSGQFSVATLQSSLERSLRELKTDYVDMLLMHSAPNSVLEQEDLLRALEQMVAAGKVRMAGISGDLPIIEEVFSRRPSVLQTAQFTFNPASYSFTEQIRRNSDLLLIGNQPFGGKGGARALRDRVRELRVAPNIPVTLREKLDEHDTQVVPELVLNCVLQGTGLRSTVVAMMQPAHIRSNIRAVETCRFSLEELQQIREWFASPVCSR